MCLFSWRIDWLFWRAVRQANGSTGADSTALFSPPEPRKRRPAGRVRARRPGGPRVFDFVRAALCGPSVSPDACVRAVTPAVWAGLLGAADRTAPAAYTKRSRGVTEERAELLSEGLFNTLLLPIRLNAGEMNTSV